MGGGGEAEPMKVMQMRRETKSPRRRGTRRETRSPRRRGTRRRPRNQGRRGKRTP